MKTPPLDTPAPPAHIRAMLTLILAAATACIASVHDGDSLRLCDGERVRIANIDAPELRGSERCSPRRVRELAGSKNPAWCDYELGVRSRDALRAFLTSGTVRIGRTGTDRYGRTLATLSVGGRGAGAHLVARGMARGWR